MMFENLKERYKKNWCRTDQLKKYVELKVITKEEFDLIVNQNKENDASER